MVLSGSLLIRGAELRRGTIADLRVTRDLIAEIGVNLAPAPGEACIEARGAALLRGLNDHHIHLFATAAARQSLHCGPPEIRDEAALRDLLLQACERGDSAIRGTGFHSSVCDRLDRAWLDAVCPDRPVRIQHRSGILWILNSCAMEQLQVTVAQDLPEGIERAADGTWTGRFFDLDDWLRRHSSRSWPSLRQLSLELAGQGITAVTDAGARNGITEWKALASAVSSGDLLQRVQVMGNEQLTDRPPTAHGRLSRGPLKLYLREAALPDYDALVERIRNCHARGRAIASHCVTRTELTFLLAALAEAGTLPGDRIEHAAITDRHALEAMARLGVTVVTQPHFIAERGSQYLQDVAVEEIPLLYRGAAFLRQGVPLAAGSDAPYGDINPWRSMQASMERRTGCGSSIGNDECLRPTEAMALFGGTLESPGGSLTFPEAGDRADLCLLDRPWQQVERAPGKVRVNLTVCNGSIIHQLPAACHR